MMEAETTIKMKNRYPKWNGMVTISTKKPAKKERTSLWIPASYTLRRKICLIVTWLYKQSWDIYSTWDEGEGRAYFVGAMLRQVIEDEYFLPKLNSQELKKGWIRISNQAPDFKIAILVSDEDKTRNYLIRRGYTEKKEKSAWRGKCVRDKKDHTSMTLLIRTARKEEILSSNEQLLTLVHEMVHAIDRIRAARSSYPMRSAVLFFGQVLADILKRLNVKN